MKIISLHIHSFGKLQNYSLNFNKDLNVMQQCNGFGKTTLATFVRTMLYGFAYNRKKIGSENITDAALWKNWSSTEKTGGSLVVEKQGKVYRVERYFGRTAREETLSFVEEHSGKSVDFGNSVGEFLLGLTVESYDRSAYFPQEFVEISSNENFDSRLAGLVQNAEDFDKVQSSLRAYRKDLRYEKGNGGKIWDAENKLAQLQGQLDACECAKVRQSQIDARFEQIAEQRQSIQKQIQKLNEREAQLQTQVAQGQLTQEQLHNREKLRQLREKLDRLGSLEEDKIQCDDLVEKIAKTPSLAKKQRGISLPLLVAGIIFLLSGAILAALVTPYLAALCAVGFLCVVLAFFVKPSLTTLPAGEKDALISQYYSIAQKYVFCRNMDFDQLQKEMWQFYNDYTADKREYEVLLKNAGSQRGTQSEEQELQQVKSQLFQLQQELQQLSVEEGRLEEERRRLQTDALPLTEQMWELKRQISQMQQQYTTAQKVSALLEQAKENLSLGYLPQLCERCSKLLSQITGCNYQLVADRNFAVQLRQNNITKPLEAFSRGVREVALLCFRVALSELLFGGDIPFLIVDDAFVNYDEQNFLRATKLLKDISQNTQVVYFTCHSRLGNLVQK